MMDSYLLLLYAGLTVVIAAAFTLAYLTRKYLRRIVSVVSVLFVDPIGRERDVGRCTVVGLSVLV